MYIYNLHLVNTQSMSVVELINKSKLVALYGSATACRNVSYKCTTADYDTIHSLLSSSPSIFRSERRDRLCNRVITNVFPNFPVFRVFLLRTCFVLEEN